MSAADFERAFEVVEKLEGGWPGDVNDPDDPGGATRSGITQATYDSYRGAHGLAKRSVFTMEREEARAIYRSEYWAVVAGDALPWPLCLVLYDAAVNQGSGYAAKLLQWGVGAIQDGKVGSKTLAALPTDADGIEELCDDLLWARVNRYVATCRSWESKGKPRPWKFLPGWVERLNDVRTHVERDGR